MIKRATEPTSLDIEVNFVYLQGTTCQIRQWSMKLISTEAQNAYTL